jgi:putative nucleotidyltransferase with HDIG domain
VEGVVAHVKKKINVQDLELGMRVIDLDRPWLETPMLFQGLEIRSEAELDELRRYCKFVYITVPENHDGPVQTVGEATRRPPPARPTGEHQRRIEFDLLKNATAPQQGEQRYLDKTTLEEEIEAVRHVHREAKLLIKILLADVSAKRPVDLEATKQVVGALVESVLRNPDALMCFNQLKDRDAYTAEHCLRTCILALNFGRHLGLDRDVLEALGVGGLLHDIGKMKLPLALLQRPGKLTQRELEIMKHHVPLGVSYLHRLPGIPPLALDVVRDHHERYDGSGYPARLQGDAISQVGQIAGLADFYDTMTSDWADHRGFSANVAIRKMYELRDKEFPQALVGQFIQCMGVYPIGSLVELNTGEVGVVVTMNRIRRLRPRVSLILRANNTPFEDTRIINLMHDSATDGRTLEIERALDVGAYGINPTAYLPLGAGARVT